MTKDETQFKEFIASIRFDDTPETEHRDRLEDCLLTALAERSRHKTTIETCRIIVKSRLTKLAAAAVIILAVLIGIGTFDETAAWAEVVKALNEVKNLHVVSTITLSDGTEIQSKWWLRKPNCLHREEPGRIVIDNGQERLTIDREKKQAQFEDSWTEYRPVSEEYMFEQIGIFRGHKVEGLTVKKLEDQSDGNIGVFRLDYESTPSQLMYQGKAWVDNNTMLPIRLTLRMLGEPEKGQAQGAEVTLDYSPISDDKFDRKVPDGYTILPRKRTQAISGKVVDVDGSPVQGATVHLTDKWLRFLRKVETDKTGELVFKLPPSQVHWVGLPLFLRAVSPNDPGRVAWTIVEDPAKKKDRGVEIPGRIGQVEVSMGNLMLQSVNGIVIQMESAGTISGCVTDMQGEPISDAEVVIEGRAIVRKPGMPIYPEFGFIGDPLGGDGPRGQLTTHTGEQGRYEVTNVPKFSNRSQYKVTASAEGFSSNEQRRETAWKSDIEQVDVQLYNAGIIVSGILVDNYGKVLGMREIRAHVGNYAGGRIYGRTKTDEKGRFVLKDCPISPQLQVRAMLAQNTWFHLGKEKRTSYTYHPNVIVPIDYEEGKMKYEVKLVAEKPEITVELEVKNTAGEPVAYYPIELQGAPGSTSTEWEEQGKFTQRTDRQGCCKFTEVPKIEDLRLVVGRAHIWYDALSGEEAEIAREENAKYQLMKVPIEVISNQKEYKIHVTILTNEENEGEK